MKILLMNTPLHSKLDCLRAVMTPPLGIYTIGSVLKNNGYTDLKFYSHKMMESYYRDDGWDRDKIASLTAGYDIIGFSANSLNWGTSRELIDIIKKSKEAPFIICGGVHPTYFDEHVLKVSKADAVVRGDGEIPILKIVEAIDHKTGFHDIPGVTFREGEQIIRNPMVIERQLPYTRISVYDEMLETSYNGVPIEASRGCKFNCSFCSCLFNKNWRAFSTDMVIEKITDAAKYLNKVQFNRIYFTDDLFSGDLQRAVDILKWLETGKVQFKVAFHARLTDFLHKKIDFAGLIPHGIVSEIMMGAECGYDEGLKKIGKGFLTRHIEECFAKLKAHDLSKYASISFVFGFPWETLSDCLKTIEFGRKIQEKYQCMVFFGWWMPLKSRLWDARAEYGFNVSEAAFDDPLYMVSEEFLYSAHGKLSRDDIEIIDHYPKITKRNLIRHIIKDEEKVQGFEI